MRTRLLSGGTWVCGKTIVPEGLTGPQLSFNFTVRIILNGGNFMKRFSRMFTFIFILSIVSALTVPAFATSSLYSTNVYHFRTAKDSSAARYVLNCHTDGIPVSGTKISLWQGTGHSSQEWFVDWTTGSLNNPTAALRPNQNRTLAINADRSAIGTVCNVIPSTGNVYNDYNITLVGSHSTRPTEVKLHEAGADRPGL